MNCAEVSREQKFGAAILRTHRTQWPMHPKAPAIPGARAARRKASAGNARADGAGLPGQFDHGNLLPKRLQDAGPLNRTTACRFPSIRRRSFGTESCVGCHYSAGACLGFRKDDNGAFIRDSSGHKIPIFGENAHGGRSGNANFSWMLQIEAKSNEKLPPPASPTASLTRQPTFLIRSSSGRPLLLVP